jgi:Rnl2 family RNA ligase
MEFKKYSSIENTYRTAEINYIRQNAFDRGEFIVEEKVHGSNFAFYYDGKEIKCAKRTQFIDDMGKSFYNHKFVLEDNKPFIEKLWKLLEEDVHTDGMKEITIYGEIFGGTYPHPEVPRSNYATQVQKGVYYHPENKFYAFDLKINGAFVMTVEKAKALFEKAGFYYAKTLLKGSFDEALAYPNEFQTTLPADFGLPEIENNICEGVVIKPNKHVFYENGSRLVLKNKNDKWSEKKSLPKEPKIDVILSDEAKAGLEEALTYVNDNRLKNVISKIGEVTQKDFGKLKGLFTKDIMEDFLKDTKFDIKLLDKGEQKKWHNTLSQEVANFIRKDFLNIIDGVY